MFAVTHATAVGTDLPIVNLTGGVNFQVRLYHLLVGFRSAPNDSQIEFEVGLTTSVGTGGTTLTENKLNPHGPAVQGAAVGGTFSAAPTYTANSGRLYFAMARRATFQWMTDPDRFPLMSTLAADNGVELLSKSVSDSGTPTATVTMMWKE